MRLFTSLSVVLVLALAAGLADRALVGQAEASRAAGLLRLDEDARLTAQAVQAALVQLEQAVIAGKPLAGGVSERLAIPPRRSVASRELAAYGERSREELAALLSSARATPNGLPEAVVARLGLGPEAPVSGAALILPVEERLLRGELPVRPEDLPYLARRLGVVLDPRVRSLARRLRSAPSDEDLPEAPLVRRRLVEAGRIEGWTRVESRWLQRYEIAPALILERAGVADRVTIPIHSAAADRPPAQLKIVAFQDVPGLSLAVRPRLPSLLRLNLLRGILWFSTAAAALGLLGTRRALAREARTVARERAFLANVTHELRTPLSAIRVLGETLADGRGEPREYGTLVAQEGQRLEALVERVLTLTRVEQTLRPVPVEPGELACAAVELARPRAERRGAHVECLLRDGLGRCRWDADAVRRALLNLIDNAISHGRPGGQVVVSAEGVGDEVRLAVTDDGPGIGRVDRRRIFGRFERGHTEAPGTGLGLFLVEEVARAHGGRVDLVTAEGKGSTFTLVLPREAGPLPPAPDQEAGA